MKNSGAHQDDERDGERQRYVFRSGQEVRCHLFGRHEGTADRLGAKPDQIQRILATAEANRKKPPVMSMAMAFGGGMPAIPGMPAMGGGDPSQGGGAPGGEAAAGGGQRGGGRGMTFAGGTGAPGGGACQPKIAPRCASLQAA